MRHLELHRYSKNISEALRFSESNVPALHSNEIRIDIHAAGLNPIDFKIAQGQLRSILRLPLPAPLGFDLAGVVSEVGSAVHHFKVGDAVFSRLPRTRMGSFAEQAVLEARFVAHAPKNMSLTHAAALPLVALTTIQALKDRANAQPGQRVLIYAGSGGLGSFAIQYAKYVLQLHVTATCSSRNAEWVRALGADEIIAYDKNEPHLQENRFDIVFDTLGGETTFHALTCVRDGGILVSVAGPPDAQFAKQVSANPILSTVLWLMGRKIQKRANKRGIQYFRFLTESDGVALTHIAECVDAGLVKPIIDSIHPFEQAIEALELLQQGRAKGKIVLIVTTNSKALDG